MTKDSLAVGRGGTIEKAGLVSGLAVSTLLVIAIALGSRGFRDFDLAPPGIAALELDVERFAVTVVTAVAANECGEPERSGLTKMA